MKIGALLLAAGGSRRLGFPKQTVMFEGITLLRRATEALLETGCEPVVVVLGAHRERMAREIAGLPIVVAENEAWESGMGSSVRAGLHEALRRAPDLGAILIGVCDQPGVTGADLRELLALYRTAGLPAAAARYGGALGVPAVFAQRLFGELLALEGDRGARRVIQKQGEQVAGLELPSAERDVDELEDLPEIQSAKNRGDATGSRHRP